MSEDFSGRIINEYTRDYLACQTKTKVTITGAGLKLEDIKKIKFTIDSNPIYLTYDSSQWNVITNEGNKIEIETKLGYYFQLSRPVQGNRGDVINLNITRQIHTFLQFFYQFTCFHF